MILLMNPANDLRDLGVQLQVTSALPWSKHLEDQKHRDLAQNYHSNLRKKPVQSLLPITVHSSGMNPANVQ